MTDQELQQAIDSSREFLKEVGRPSGPLYEARTKTKLALHELEKIQVTRAAMATAPTLTEVQP
jgi:hypothetical protein